MKGVCSETRLRIRLSIWAYAYEFENDSMVSDAEFDAACREVDLAARTKRPDLDDWWIDNFDPSTGMWIRQHPELDKVRSKYWFLKTYKPPVEDDLDAAAAALV